MPYCNAATWIFVTLNHIRYYYIISYSRSFPFAGLIYRTDNVKETPSIEYSIKIRIIIAVTSYYYLISSVHSAQDRNNKNNNGNKFSILFFVYYITFRNYTYSMEFSTLFSSISITNIDFYLIQNNRNTRKGLPYIN